MTCFPQCCVVVTLLATVYDTVMICSWLLDHSARLLVFLRFDVISIHISIFHVKWQKWWFTTLQSCQSSIPQQLGLGFSQMINILIDGNNTDIFNVYICLEVI